MASSITCKLSYGDEMRRFTSSTDQITYSTVQQRANRLFAFDGTTDFKLQYEDDEGDMITMTTEEEMVEAISLALSNTPPTLRVSVKLAEPKAAPLGATGAGVAAATDLNALFNEALPKFFEAVTGGTPPGGFSTVCKNVAERLPVFLAQLPTQGYGDQGCHPGVVCDKSGMSPIVGPRFNLKGHNYDLCEAEYNKLEPSEQVKFVRIEPPCFGRRGWSRHSKCPSFMGEGRQGVHPGVTCDKSGMSPIVGPRFNLKGHNYDLCEAEYNKLERGEQAKFVRIEPPSFVPWKPKCWKGNMSQACGGQAHSHKLAARFVSDVSIFDGTQMAPSTRFTKIWRIKNVGETAWPQGSKLLFVGGDQMSADMAVPLSETNDKMVMPGEEIDVAVDMVAPPEAGRYLGYWRLVGPWGRRRFGQRFWCHIQVVDPSASEAASDPTDVDGWTSIAAEISSLMAQAQKNDPDADDDDNAETKAETNGCDHAATSAMANPAAAASSAAAASLTAKASSAASGLSSAASSAPSSAVSVKKEDSKAEIKEKSDPDAAEKEDFVDVSPPSPKRNGKEPASEDPAAPKDPKEAVAVNAEETDVATQLLQMGFDPKNVELILEKNAGESDNMLEQCARDLMQLSDWDSMLSDLEEMGFSNRELNTRLMVKHNGSVKRTVKDLVAEIM